MSTIAHKTTEKYAFTAEDGDVRTFPCGVFKQTGVTTKGFGAEFAPPYNIPQADHRMKWEVHVTDQRLLFWSPWRARPIGAPNEKPGKSTGFEVDYKDLTSIAVDATNSAKYCTDKLGQIREIYVRAVLDNGDICETQLGLEAAKEFFACFVDKVKAFQLNNNALLKKLASGGKFENATFENFKTAALSVTLSEGSDYSSYDGRLVLNGVVPYITRRIGGDKIDQTLTDVAAYAKAGIYLEGK